MNVLMTGATGFLGRSTSRLLRGMGHRVFSLTRSLEPEASAFQWDFQSTVPVAVPRCDLVIHLAAVVDFSQSLHFESFNVNTVSTMYLLQYALAVDCPVIYTSSVAVYGQGCELITGASEVSPDNSYALSKYLAERAIEASGVSFSILRFMGIYGVDGPSHLGLNAAITNALRLGKPPVLKGSGTAKRNYILVDDAASWIASLATQADHEGRLEGNILRAGSDEVLTIREYLNIVCDVLLDGVTLVVEPGQDSRDMLVLPSPPPSPSTLFSEYLKGVKEAS